MMGTCGQVAALCRLPSGGVPATYLNSQQNTADTQGVYSELRKVCSVAKNAVVVSHRSRMQYGE